MRETDGDRLVRFAEVVGRMTKGSAAGRPVEWRNWQTAFLRELAASRARIAYVQVARKNSKSMLGSVIALHGLCGDGEEGAEVYSIAGSRDQARIVFGEAARMVELGPLRRVLKVYRNEIVHPASGSRYRALAAEAGLHEGTNPHLAICDEVHVLGSDRRLFDVMRLGMGTRDAPLLLAITTPGVRYGRDGHDSLAWTLYEMSRRIAAGEAVDEAFYSKVWEAPPEADVHDEEAWRLANPALGDFLSIEDMRAAVRTTPENEFRTKRMGQWVASQEAWLPGGAWDSCEIIPEPPPAGTPIVLGFDGSKSRDSTALLGATVEPRPHLFVVAVWERPMMAHHSWQVPRAEVTETVARSCERWRVREIASDSALWLSELQDWSLAGLPVVEYPQTPSRMVPATQRFYEAAVTGSMRHDGNPVLARHVGSAVIKPSGQIAKDHKDSARKIDAAVAGVMAYDRAAILGNAPTRRPVFVA